MLNPVVDHEAISSTVTDFSSSFFPSMSLCLCLFLVSPTTLLAWNSGARISISHCTCKPHQNGNFADAFRDSCFHATRFPSNLLQPPHIPVAIVHLMPPGYHRFSKQYSDRTWLGILRLYITKDSSNLPSDDLFSSCRIKSSHLITISPNIKFFDCEDTLAIHHN